MSVAITVSLFAVILAYFGKYDVKGLFFAFFVIFVFQALRFDYGPDYMEYLAMFKEINGNIVSLGSISSLYDITRGHEIGWVIINILCKPIGFFGLIIVLAAFENWVIYSFVKKYVPHNMYWVAVACYALSSTLFLISACSMLRQWLAIILFLIAFQYIEKRDPLKYCLIIAVAITIHTSAFILLPFYFVTKIPQIKAIPFKLLAVFILFYIVWVYFAPQLLSDNIVSLLSLESFEHYSGHLEYEANVVKSNLLGRINTIISLYVVPFIVVLSIPNLNKVSQHITVVYLFSLLFLPLVSVVHLIDRLGYYFLVFSICAIPLALNVYQQKKNANRIIVYGIFIVYALFTIRSFLSLPSSEIWSSFQEYETIFSVNWQ